jgi:chemotaxis protein MotB
MEPRLSWMLTFSDLCTLLLTFFVLLLSMSSPNKKAFESTFGHRDKAGSAVVQQGAAASSKDTAIRDVSSGIQRTGSTKVLSSTDSSYERETGTATDATVSEVNTVFLQNDQAEDRFSFVLDGSILFGKGEAVIDPDAYFILEAMGSFLHESTYRAYVDAHASATQVSPGRYGSADELSTARGQAVLSFLVNSCKVAPERLSFGCYGGVRPASTNKTQTGRAMNQYIEVIFEKTS